MIEPMRTDPIELEIFKNIYHSIAEEMGAALRRTAFSPNIKERRDYSCAIFDAYGEVIAMGDHMPVHLGSMPMSVRAAIDSFPLGPGDVAMLNDPFRGGTHLPDITLVAPVYIGRKRRGQDALATARGDAGAKESGPRFLRGLARASRGCRWDLSRVDGVVPRNLSGRIAHSAGADHARREDGGDVLALLLNNVRTPNEREGDLGAQIAACHTGAERLREVCARYGLGRAQSASRRLLDYSEQMMRAFLAQVPKGTYRAEDFMDSDGISDRPVKIAVAVKFRRRARAATPRGHSSHRGFHRFRSPGSGQYQCG